MNALLEKCPNIRCVSLPLVRILVVTQFLEYIRPHVLNIFIECLRITFDGNIILTNTFFTLMSTAMSDILIHLDVSLSYNNLFSNASFSQFMNLSHTQS
jgi:hypothetical protein